MQGSNALRGCTSGSRRGDGKRSHLGGCSSKSPAWEMLTGQQAAQKSSACPGFGLSIQQPWCWAGLWAQPSSCSQGHSSTALTRGSLKPRCQGAATPPHPHPCRRLFREVLAAPGAGRGTEGGRQGSKTQKPHAEEGQGLTGGTGHMPPSPTRCPAPGRSRPAQPWPAAPRPPPG